MKRWPPSLAYSAPRLMNRSAGSILEQDLLRLGRGQLESIDPPLRQRIAIARRDRRQGTEILRVLQRRHRAEIIAEAEERPVIAYRVGPPLDDVGEPGIATVH